MNPSESESYEEQKVNKINTIKIENEKNNWENEQKIDDINSKTKKRIFDNFIDYFFNTNLNNKKKSIKENKNQEIKPKNEEKNSYLLYHYQQNQGKGECKRNYERSFLNKNNNIRNKSIEKRINSSYTNKNNNIKIYENKLNQKKYIMQSYNIKPINLRKTLNFKNNIEIAKTNKHIITSNNIESKKSQRGIFKTKTELARIKKFPKFSDESNYITNLQKSIKNNIPELNGHLIKRTNNIFDYDTFDNNDYDSASLILNSSIISKNRNINNFNLLSDYGINNSNKTYKSKIRIRNNSNRNKINLKMEDLSLYKGEINYNNVSAKNIADSVNVLMAKYKSKGYTCVKKDKSKYKFVKGPNIHNVEIMRLGNGLIYFNINKL